MIAVVFAVAVGLVVLGSLLGRSSAGSGVAGVVTLGLPIALIVPAAVMPTGITGVWAVIVGIIAAVAVLTALIGPVRPSIPASIAAALGAIILVGLVIRWAAGVIAALGYLDARMVALVLVVATVPAACWAGARRVQARLVMIVTIVVAVLLLVAGIALGTPSQFATSYVPVQAPHTTVVAVFALCMIVVGLGHPGLRGAREAGARPVIIGAIVLGLLTMATLLGLIFLLGGAVAFPSWPLAVLSVYASPAAPVTVAIVAVVAVIAAVATLAAAVDGAAQGLAPTERAAAARWISVVVGGALALLVVLAPLDVVAWGCVAGVLFAIAFVLAWRGRDRGAAAPAKEPAASEA